ncbi:MAG TPA: hypothetical protein VNC41_14070, partial [Acidimicrobiia bacterium]|nr:hypothetical protein [Acidimicrobiia bacterium]
MLLVATDARFEAHNPGRSHPERPERLRAVEAGLTAVDREALRPLEPRLATRSELELVHTSDYLDGLEAFCA